MFTQTERLIAVRNLRPKRKQGFLKIISLFSFLGIMLGVAILIIVMSVMNGFRSDLTNKIIGLNPHLVLQFNNSNDLKNIKKKIIQKYKDIHLAETINKKYPNRRMEITVSEDGENGATIQYEV